MKVIKESLLFNDLKNTLDAVEKSVLIMRNEKQPIVMMTLEEYNEMKKKMYKNKQ